ncbi:hypothetical protein EYF80_037368 [Liparis tanakae]|uniref:Uncharacterized protein n=1 Tax=Liparis tanakae TaxID=230148 RepID=A0A4Z2GFU9_9TELE|nr:hypothetical protein EYF80_037368 [Liparis tanakae]
MTHLIGSEVNERSLYLVQIKYLEEQLERCQQTYDELDDRDLRSRYDELERDKKESTGHPKRLVDAKERKEEELSRRLLAQPAAAAHAQRALRLQQSLELQGLQQRLDGLLSESCTRAAECLKQQELKEQQTQLKQQNLDAEIRTRRLARDIEELEAAIEVLKTTEAEPNRAIEILKDIIDKSRGRGTSQILREDRAITGKQIDCLHFLLDGQVTLPRQRDALQDQNRELRLQINRLSAVRKRGVKERITCDKLKAELDARSSAHSSMLARTDALRQLAALESEESRQRADEEEEEVSVTEGKIKRLLEILESSAIPGSRPRPQDFGLHPQRLA